MNIGIVCYPTVGGSGVIATELGHHLAARGHQIHFISYEVPFRLQVDDFRIFFHRVEINRYDLFRYPDYALTLAVKMAQVAKDCSLDLLHVHYAIPHAASAYLARQLMEDGRVKIVTTLHGTDITLVGRDPGYQSIVEFSINQSDAVTVVSKNLREQTIEHFRPRVPIEVIYNFCKAKPAWLGNKILKKKYAQEDEKLIIHASNFRNIKATLNVIEIFKLIQEELPAKLLMLGSGEEFNKTRALTDSYHLQDRVVFLGQQLLIDPYLAFADLFLLPSEQESFGLAALEALAYGVPIVCSDVGGLPEVVQDGLNGFLLPAGDIGGMAKQSLRVLIDPALHERFSLSGKERVREHFGPEKIVAQYESCYQSIL